MMEEERPPGRTEDPRDRRATAIQKLVGLELAISHRVHHAATIELVASFTQSKHRGVLQIEAHLAGCGIEAQALNRFLLFVQNVYGELIVLHHDWAPAPFNFSRFQSVVQHRDWRGPDMIRETNTGKRRSRLQPGTLCDDADSQRCFAYRSKPNLNICPSNRKSVRLRRYCWDNFTDCFGRESAACCDRESSEKTAPRYFS